MISKPRTDIVRMGQVKKYETLNASERENVHSFEGGREHVLIVAAKAEAEVKAPGTG